MVPINKYRDSAAKKVGLLAFSLIIDPRSIRSYFGTLDKQPIDVGLPWISFGAIHFLEKYLRSTMEVFEYGAGGSTLFFASRCQKVVTVEDSLQWASRVCERLQGTKNVDVKSIPTETISYGSDGLPVTSTDFGASDYVHAIDGMTPEVVLIDGFDDWNLRERRRTICFRHVEPSMKSGNIIILDDSWAYPEVLANNQAKYVQTFWGAGPCRRGCTRTDVYFY